MVKQQNKHFTIKFEYPCVHVDILHTDLLIFRGIKHGQFRPAHITVICNKEERGYIITENTKRLFMQLLPILDVSSNSQGRLKCKPYWFHKKLFKGI